MLQAPIKVCVTLGTRPEAIKLAPVIRLLRESAYFQAQVVLTGQHREMVDELMKLFEIVPDHNLQIMQTQQSLTDITCRSLQGLEGIFRQLQPQLVLVQGDTTTAFAAALAAFYQQIPVGHVEAGLRTDDLFNPYPEEANRRLISQIAQLHFAPTAQAVENLDRSGVRVGVHQTGNTVIDALLQVASRQPTCVVPGLDWQKHQVLLTTVHRRENWGEPLGAIAGALLEVLHTSPRVAILLPLHPNPQVRGPLRAHLADHPRAFLVEPLDYPQLVAAMQHCTLVLTDSGGLQEEAPSFGKPVLVLRQTTERPEAVAAGTARLVGTEPSQIVTAVHQLLTEPDTYQRMATATNPFGDGQAAQRILAILENYFLCVSPS